MLDQQSPFGNFFLLYLTLTIFSEPSFVQDHQESRMNFKHVSEYKTCVLYRQRRTEDFLKKESVLSDVVCEMRMGAASSVLDLVSRVIWLEEKRIDDDWEREQYFGGNSISFFMRQQKENSVAVAVSHTAESNKIRIKNWMLNTLILCVQSGYYKLYRFFF